MDDKTKFYSWKSKEIILATLYKYQIRNIGNLKKHFLQLTPVVVAYVTIYVKDI